MNPRHSIRNANPLTSVTAFSTSEMRSHWLLEPGLHFLNHGSFGATPRTVLEAQQAWRDRIELQPVRFMVDELPGLLRHAASELAAFLGVNGEDLAFVENATAGVNAVLRAYPWQAGEELLLSSYAYPAVKNAARFVARQCGIVVREFQFPFPLWHRDQIVDAFAQALTPRTRIALIDHVSSPLAIIYPLREMITKCRAHGVQVLVDGAHAPGMLPLSIQQLEVDWYIGNAHKWLYAPKGCGFLWASPSARDFLQPPVISLRMDDGFPVSFDWVGTRDPTAWLTISKALEFYRECGGDAIPAMLHQRAIFAVSRLCEAWGAQMPAPQEMFGAMVTLPIPVENVTPDHAMVLQRALRDRYQVEVPLLCFNGAMWGRISCQFYNDESDYAALEDAVMQLR